MLDSAEIETSLDDSFDRYSWDTAFRKIKGVFDSTNLEKSLIFSVDNLNEFMVKLFGQYQVIIAAGGFVTNGKNQLLMIHRRGYWDLPKGKIEPNETEENAAKREVQEECGVDNLTIISDAIATYHVYLDHGKPMIKKSIWFKMNTGFEGDLVPQIEEDIEKVDWFDQPIDRAIRDGCYSSIKEVLDYFSDI